MAEERIARPVSGEIMSDAAQGPLPASGRRDMGDIVDAEFESLSGRSDSSIAPPRQPPQPPSAGLDMLRAAPPRRGERGGPLFWTFAMALVIGAFWVSGGHALVAPQGVPASPQRTDMQALRIVNVTTRVIQGTRDTALLVDGEVRNGGSERRVVPPLSIVVTGKDGRVTTYFLGTRNSAVEPGASFAFSGRLAAPKDGVGTVTVDFRQEGDN